MISRTERKHRLLGIREVQARGQAAGIFADEHRKRREPRHGVGLAPQRLLDCDQAPEPLKPRHAAENVRQQPVIEQRLDRAHRLRRDEDAPHLARDPLRRELRHPAAERDRSPKSFRSNGPLP